MEHWEDLESPKAYKWSLPFPNTDDLFDGYFNGRQCVFKTFSSDENASSYTTIMLNLGIPNVPQVFHLFPKKVIFDIKYQPIYHFFNDRASRYWESGNGSFYQYIESCFKQVFFGSLSGMRSLYKEGFVVRNFMTTTSIFSIDTNDQPIYRPYFMDIVRIPEGEEGIDLVVKMITDVRDSMRYVLGLNGLPYDHHEFQRGDNGVPQAILNFLTKADDNYVRFMSTYDVDYLLFDPMMWDTTDKIIRNWFRYMLFVDKNKKSAFRDEMAIYDELFSGDWKNRMKGSFFEHAITDHLRKEQIKRNKIGLADSIIELDNDVPPGCGRDGALSRTMQKFKVEDLEKVENVDGVQSYNSKAGLSSIVKLERNGVNHHNDSARDMNMPMKTLDDIVDMVETDFGFSCSYIFWYMNHLWYEGLVNHWIDHKNMLKGEICWDDVCRP